MLLRLARLSTTLMVTAIVSAVLVLILWAAFCQPAGQFEELTNGAEVLVAGRVVGAPEHGDGGRASGTAVYRVEDPSGAIWVISDRGTPAAGAVVVVRLRKATSDTGRPVGVELQRLGTY